MTVGYRQREGTHLPTVRCRTRASQTTRAEAGRWKRPYQALGGAAPFYQELYEQVTTYVREGMNRAEKLDGKRRNTVGFALTVLQRRLASSPEAIYRSLERRAARLERRKQEILDGTTIAEPKATDVIGDDNTGTQDISRCAHDPHE